MALSSAAHSLYFSRVLLPKLNLLNHQRNISTCPISPSAIPGLLSLSGSTFPSRTTKPQCCFHTSASITAASPIQASIPTRTATMEVADTITLNDTERELFSTLLAAAEHAGTGTVLRAAGGWVRDKLLGKDSLDIDIALDNMLGKDFAEKVNEYLKSQGKETRNAAVIQSNPDQSKHLETARMKIGGLWIDLVNLRSETYAQDSRIPTMAFGTPQQDAMRRDFTVNSLFYNINQGVVEDLTGRGLEDLRAGVIRTPLPARETFLDDPLRVLRAVRFGTRFGFQLEEQILEAAASEEVRTALGQKVSKERVGTELEGMFNGADPIAALQLLNRLSLFPIVFAAPPALQPKLGQQYGDTCVTCAAACYSLLKASGVEVDLEGRRFLLLAALLLPLRRLQAAASKGKPLPLSSAIVRDAIKWRSKDMDMAVLLHEVAEELAVAYGKLKGTRAEGAAGSGEGDEEQAPASSSGSGSSPSGRGRPWSGSEEVCVLLGNAIRKLKAHWRLGLLLMPVLSTRAASPLQLEAGPLPGGPYEEDLGEDKAAKRLEVYRDLMSAVEGYGLQDCWQWKPLMDGKQVMALLGWQKPGPELGKAMALAAEWHMVHPQGGLEGCKAFLLERYSQGGQQQGQGAQPMS